MTVHHRLLDDILPLIDQENVIKFGRLFLITLRILCLAAMPYCQVLILIIGPRFGHDHPEIKLLKEAVLNSISAADSLGCRSLSIPAISCGIFLQGHEAKLEMVASTIVNAVVEGAKSTKCLEVMRIVIKDRITLDAFKSLPEFED